MPLLIEERVMADATPPSSGTRLLWSRGCIVAPIVLGFGAMLVFVALFRGDSGRPNIDFGQAQAFFAADATEDGDGPTVAEAPSPEAGAASEEAGEEAGGTWPVRLLQAQVAEREARFLRIVWLGLLYVMALVVMVMSTYHLFACANGLTGGHLAASVALPIAGFLVIVGSWVLPISPFETLTTTEWGIFDAGRTDIGKQIYDPDTSRATFERAGRWHHAVAFGAAAFALGVMGAALVRKGLRSKKVIAEQLHQVRQLFYVLAGLLVVGVILVDASRQWMLAGAMSLAASGGHGESGLVSDIEGLHWSLTLSRGVVYSAVLLFAYLPSVRLLRARVDSLAGGDGEVTDTEALQAGRDEVGLETSWKTMLPKVLTVLAPMISAPLLAMLQQLFT